MKIIVDGSYKKPDHGRIAMFVTGEKVIQQQARCTSSTHAEIMAIKMALDYLVKHNLKNATIISDCQSVVDKINQVVVGSKILEYKVVLNNIQHLLKATKSTLIWEPRKNSLIPDLACQYGKDNRYKTISLPRLDKLNPTIESTCIKLSEEVGELSRLVGRMRGLSGERNGTNQQTYNNIGKELLDVAQTAITMMFVLEEQHKVKIDPLIKQHHNKLKTKNYMS